MNNFISPDLLNSGIQNNPSQSDIPAQKNGQIFVVLGTSTAGKTSIIRSIKEKVPKCFATSMDEYGPLFEAHWIKENAPLQYARMARALKPSDIAEAIFSNSSDSPRWKENCTSEIKKIALQALKRTKIMTPFFGKKKSFPQIETKMFDLILHHSSKGETVLFDVRHPEVFIKHMQTKNFEAPLHIILAYCPFAILADRVMKRNANALQNDKNDWRSPTQPLRTFPQMYRTAKRGEKAIDILQRKEVEKALDSAFAQEIDYYSKLAKDDPTAAEKLNFLNKNEMKEKKAILEKLGFSDSKITEVPIVPRYKEPQFQFNTKDMSPEQCSTAILTKLKDSS